MPKKNIQQSKVKQQGDAAVARSQDRVTPKIDAKVKDKGNGAKPQGKATICSGLELKVRHPLFKLTKKGGTKSPKNAVTPLLE